MSRMRPWQELIRAPADDAVTATRLFLAGNGRNGREGGPSGAESDEGAEGRTFNTNRITRHRPNLDNAGRSKLRGTHYFFNIITPPASKAQLTLSRLRRRARLRRHTARGSSEGWAVYWRAVAVSAPEAASASLLMRATIEARPFERWGVRWSFKPSLTNTALSSVARMSRAALPE